MPWNIMCFSKENASPMLLKACSVQYISARKDVWTTQVEQMKKKKTHLTKKVSAFAEFRLVAWIVGRGQEGILGPA